MDRPPSCSVAAAASTASDDIKIVFVAEPVPEFLMHLIKQLVNILGCQ